MVTDKDGLDPPGDDPAGPTPGDPGLPTGVVYEAPDGPGAPRAGLLVGGATHFVQIVEVDVMMMVDADWVT